MEAAAFRELRTKLRLTQEGLARFLRVSRVTVQNWERGSARIPHRAVRSLKMRPEFGPVILWHVDDRVTPNTFHKEPFANNAQALERACELWGKPGVFHLVIAEKNLDDVWTADELEAEVLARRRRAKLAAPRTEKTRSPEEVEARYRKIMDFAKRFQEESDLGTILSDDDLYDEYGLPK